MTALLADDLIVRPAHLMLALDCETRTLSIRILAGQIPPPDGYGKSSLKLWRLSTIRNWQPSVADAIEQILAIPVFAPRPQLRYNAPRLAA